MVIMFLFMFVFLHFILSTICIEFLETDRGLISFVQIPLIYEYLFYKYFVRRSVGEATNEKI